MWAVQYTYMVASRVMVYTKKQRNLLKDKKVGLVIKTHHDIWERVRGILNRKPDGMTYQRSVRNDWV